MAHTKAKAKGEVKEMASNRRARDRVQEMKSDVTSHNRGKYVHTASDCWSYVSSLGTPMAKPKPRTRQARTARTRKAKASKLDPSMMLDNRKNPKLRQDHLSLVCLIHHKVVLFASLNQWNRETAE